MDKIEADVLVGRSVVSTQQEPLDPGRPQLRTYQEDAIRLCLDALHTRRPPLTRIGVSAPTASGKTMMFTHLFPRIPDQGTRTQVLILVNSIDLARQTMKTIEDVHGRVYRVGIEAGGQRTDGRRDVTVATWQTMSKPARLRLFDPALFKLVIIDEARHSAAASYLIIGQYFNHQVERDMFLPPCAHSHLVPIVGFSETFARSNEKWLGQMFQKVVYHLEIEKLLSMNQLSPVVFKTDNLNKNVVEAYLKEAGGRLATLVFCGNVHSVYTIVEDFERLHIDARAITGMTKPFERASILKDFREGKFPVLINCLVLIEGADLPTVDCVILARATRSLNYFAQMVGRGLRLSPSTNKEYCLVLDLFGVSRRFGLGVTPNPEGGEGRRNSRFWA